MPQKGEMYRAGLPVLGARLLAAGKLVRPGGVCADIGCDHGKLAVWLALRGVCPRVIAVDNRPMPLEKARALVAQTGCSQVVACRLGDGLGALAPGEARDIVIAGLSGETIVEILSPWAWLRSAEIHLILVPVRRDAFLREWLCRNGFAIHRETPVLEKGRGYAVLSAGYSGEAFVPGALFCEVGLVPAGEPKAAAAYVARRLRDLEKQALAPMEPSQRERLEKLTQEVRTCLP